MREVPELISIHNQWNTLKIDAHIYDQLIFNQRRKGSLFRNDTEIIRHPSAKNKKKTSIHISHHIQNNYLKFPGCLVVRIWCFHCDGLGSILGRATEILKAAQCSQNNNNHLNKCKSWNPKVFRIKHRRKSLWPWVMQEQ